MAVDEAERRQRPEVPIDGRDRGIEERAELVSTDLAAVGQHDRVRGDPLPDPFAVALELLLTGDPITAARAAEIGLVNLVTPEGGALDGALELARTIAANGPLAVAVTKQVARSSADWTLDEGWGEQMKLMAPVFESADAREGATAFSEKRAPIWTGR